MVVPHGELRTLHSRPEVRAEHGCFRARATQHRVGDHLLLPIGNGVVGERGVTIDAEDDVGILTVGVPGAVERFALLVLELGKLHHDERVAPQLVRPCDLGRVVGASVGDDDDTVGYASLSKQGLDRGPDAHLLVIGGNQSNDSGHESPFLSCDVNVRNIKTSFLTEGNSC